MNDRWTIDNLLPQQNDFWTPDEDRIRNLPITKETV